MNYLLDTHTFLWMLFDDEKFSKPAKTTLTDLDHAIYVSTITYWEIALKYALGKLELQSITPDQLPALARKLLLQTLPLSVEDASTFYQLPRLSHKDPFDRLIIWQAIRGNLTLISKDEWIEDYQRFGLHLLW